MMRILLVKPTLPSKAPPMKNPTPFKVFLEPVNNATARYKLALWLLGASNLTALLALILLRSLAIPESAWAAITHATVSM